jgi:hypothetical protein
MLREDLIFVGTCDIAGHVRGKGFPARELPGRKKQGIGWTHSNLMQTAFGPILDTPFGTGGDLMVVPDMSAETRVDFGDGSAPEHFIPWRPISATSARRSLMSRGSIRRNSAPATQRSIELGPRAATPGRSRACGNSP